MTSTASVADAPSASKDMSITSKVPFRLSQNWTVLQTSLPQELSKKRKRTSKTPSKPQSTTIQPKKKTLTTYNPWRPSDSVSRKTGNPALILPSQTSDKVIKPGRYIAIDCEMVGVGANGTEDALARVSIVNYYGNVLFDTFVSPMQRVTDWRTKYSGIRPADILNTKGTAPEIILNSAKSFDMVQKEVMELLNDRVIIGHALKGDLAVLKLSHPRHAIRDTSSYEPFRTKYGSGRTPSLKKIVEGELGVNIQISEHDSIEDAQAAMALYRSIHEDYEKIIRIRHSTAKTEDKPSKEQSSKKRKMKK